VVDEDSAALCTPTIGWIGGPVSVKEFGISIGLQVEEHKPFMMLNVEFVKIESLNSAEMVPKS